MNQRVVKWFLPMLIVFLAACGAAGENGQPGPEQPAPPVNGRLIAEGGSYIHTFHLTSGGTWQQRLRHSSVYGIAAVHEPANELVLAIVSASAPLRLAIHDLEGFGLKQSFEWPDSHGSDYTRIRGLAVSPDGHHFAAIIESSGADFVEIIDSRTRETRFRGSLALAANDLLWLDDETLAFSAHLSDTEWAGGIVAASLDDLAGDGATIPLCIILPFTADEWALDKPSSLAISGDSRQLAYSYNSDIWLKDLTDSEAAPQQLTTGPSRLAGATFSPDGTQIALVERRSPTLSNTFVFPLNHGNPLFIDGSNTEAGAFLLEASTVVDSMLMWQP